MAAVEHYVYKYRWNNQVIYIGKVDSDLQRRVEEHTKEEKFQLYHNSGESPRLEASAQAAGKFTWTSLTFSVFLLPTRLKPLFWNCI